MREKYGTLILTGRLLVGLLTLRCGLKGKTRALYLAIIHPKRRLYRYCPWWKTA